MIGPWLVHALTASGALLALAALAAADAGDIRIAFLALAAATAVDSIDGWLARRVRVKDRLPGFDGARLDDIVDYLTFVFVPAALLLDGGWLPPAPWGPAVAGAILLSSAYGFAQANAKTADHFFTGFPSYWNIVALYLVAGRLDPWVSAAILTGLAVLVFVPIGYVYPSRTPVLRGLTVGLGLVWGAQMVALIAALPAPSPLLWWSSLAYPVYYLGLSFVLHARRAAPPARGPG